MNEYYLSLGSNKGNREENLGKAYREILEISQGGEGSHLYRTEPWGREDLDEFMNACCRILIEHGPEELLEELEKIESKMGAGNRDKWGSRLIDIDILLAGNLIYISHELKIPHEYLRDRRFYLEPLSEIGADVRDPLTGFTIFELLKKCEDDKKVWKTGDTL